MERGVVPGKVCPPYTEVVTCEWKRPLYKEHDDAYYKECVENLAQKGIVLGGEEDEVFVS